MLVLTRKAGERLNIGDDIEVRILSVKGDKVRIGVDAPLNISVHRSEIYSRVQAERERLHSQETAE